MAISQLAAKAQAAIGGGIGAGQPTEDGPEAGAIWGALEAGREGDPINRLFTVNSTTNVVTIGITESGQPNHTSKWTPGAGGDGTWDGLQKR